MTGSPFERESKRARKRRMERERQLQTATAAAPAEPQLAIRDVFSPATAVLTSESAAGGQADEILDEHFDILDADDHEVAFDGDASVSQPETASVQVAALQSALHEKDELVHALTVQLEEAANRLDRLHRAGADRASRGSSVAAEGHGAAGELGDQLSRLSSEWDELQLAQQFETIRGRLDDIFDAVTLGKLTEQGYGSRPAEEPVSRTSEMLTGKLTGWEDMKAQLLRDGAEKTRSHAELAEAAVNAVSDSEAEVLSDLPLEPPLPVDLEIADRDLLVAAVEERDVFILHLIRRLRSGTSARYAPINWAEISGAPDELRERLQEHEARLQELLRMEECDLSLERARLARERARLEQLRRDVERDARDGHDLSGDDADRNERRWLRVFGFGRKPDSDE
ncbi:MAG: hypothetical protein JNG89_07435 [Planctomycetaceae bacterium]|nr:hypothetical protein [Planctomycetaceae bacterium]